MRSRVFYCWQADSPPSTNHFLIRDALRRAIESHNETSAVELELDEAAEEVRGLVEIPDHIRSKLEACSIFVMDLTIVGRVLKPDSTKVQPNSNVLFEAGYVLAIMRRRKLDPPPVIIIMNTTYGDPGQLPFDLGWRPVVRYDLPGDASSSDRREATSRLSGTLTHVLKSIVEGGQLFAGLSAPAWKLGSVLDGLPYNKGTFYDLAELLELTDLSEEEVKRGAAELMARGLLEEAPVSGAAAGWPIAPAEGLYLVFDPFIQDWHPGEDARQILEVFGAEEDSQVSAAQVQKHFGWDLRRLEPAFSQLIHDLLAEDMGEINPPYYHSRLRLTRNADLYLRGVLDPESLQRRA